MRRGGRQSARSSSATSSAKRRRPVVSRKARRSAAGSPTHSFHSDRPGDEPGGPGGARRRELRAELLVADPGGEHRPRHAERRRDRLAPGGRARVLELEQLRPRRLEQHGALPHELAVARGERGLGLVVEPVGHRLDHARQPVGAAVGERRARDGRGGAVEVLPVGAHEDHHLGRVGAALQRAGGAQPLDQLRAPQPVPGRVAVGLDPHDQRDAVAERAGLHHVADRDVGIEQQRARVAADRVGDVALDRALRVRARIEPEAVEHRDQRIAVVERQDGEPAGRIGQRSDSVVSLLTHAPRAEPYRA